MTRCQNRFTHPPKLWRPAGCEFTGWEGEAIASRRDFHFESGVGGIVHPGTWPRFSGADTGCLKHSRVHHNRYQGNVADLTDQIHTIAMGVQSVFLDFTRSITVGAGVVLGIIVLVSLGIPRRAIASLPRHQAGKSH